MKKILSLTLVVLMLVAMLCACSENPTNNPSTDPDPTPGAGSQETDPTDDSGNNGGDDSSDVVVIDVSDYLSDSSKWEFDSEYAFVKDGKLEYDNEGFGDFAAAMLTEAAKNVTYKITLTVNGIPSGLDDSNWWDSELLIMGRSSIAGPGWRDDGSQTGYCLTSWGDLSEVCIGRAGKDDLATVEWNINDGQPHEIELSVVSNEDDSVVTITLVVDGVELAKVEDDGSQIKNDRPASYPNAGNLTIRAKWVDITVE